MNLDHFSSKFQEPLIFPVGEYPAHGERGHGCYLRQCLLRDVDFNMAVYVTTYLIE